MCNCSLNINGTYFQFEVVLENDYNPSTVQLLKKVILLTPKFPLRKDHMRPKFEKQVKPLGFPSFEEAPPSCPKFQINALGLEIEWLHFWFLKSCI